MLKGAKHIAGSRVTGGAVGRLNAVLYCGGVHVNNEEKPRAHRFPTVRIQEGTVRVRLDSPNYRTAWCTAAEQALRLGGYMYAEVGIGAYRLTAPHP